MSSSTVHHQLLGPPQIYIKQQNPAIDASHVSDKGYTENGSSTFNSSGNPLLDFFFHVVPNTPAESVTERLELAWNYNPLKALKLICNLRGIRGTGKSDREGFYAAALWLHKHHPKTLACNLKAIAAFGYFKDLPEILYRLFEGIDRKNKPGNSRCRGTRFTSHPNKRLKTASITKSREERISDELKRVQVRKETASFLRKEKRAAKAKKAMERYKRDPDYRFLHDKISELFAECLVSEFLKSGKPKKISLAAKWCPSIDYSFNQSTLLCEGIARRVFPRNSSPEYEHIKEAYYTYRIRDRLRKEYLVPLRKALQSPEIYMSSNNWKELPYNRVPSVAMKNYKGVFGEHDKERFEDYLESVKRGDKKIAAGALLPHQIIKSLEYDDDDGCSVAELQWKRMVDDLSKVGKLKDCLAICDVSGSMEGTPLEASVALGLLISELSEDPWKGNLITFSTDPKLQKIKGHSLRSKIKSIERMHWEMSTDFQKVFKLILRVAYEGKLTEEQMIKRLFVFSDMEFDQASKNDWETDYEAIRRKFKRYGNTSVPEIVFWNLRDSKATPVVSNQKGVALVSGFSKNLVKLFLEGANDMTPLAVMERAISGEAYSKLVVID
ncbi:hypothetical protein MKW98_030319 [Papaver atlanticum]|uniref:Uncharacterized protein n=1 Tax=Papaver atlanticum TaxID=357466 RepID=A0AAD4TKE4_9MAGN|nr:hypothetical protein MKW98_030319 [Papaver atlanticum]